MKNEDIDSAEDASGLQAVKPKGKAAVGNWLTETRFEMDDDTYDNEADGIMMPEVSSLFRPVSCLSPACLLLVSPWAATAESIHAFSTRELRHDCYGC